MELGRRRRLLPPTVHLITSVMTKLVVKLRIPLNLVDDNYYYCKESKLRGSSSSSSNSKLDSYLTTSFEFGEDFQDIKFSIPQWWKEHSTQFSIMAIIAKQNLATLVSTVAVEQTFSAGRSRSILDQIYSSMSSNLVETQACLDDWTKAALNQ